MGVFDNVQLDENIELPDLEDPPQKGWQTKSFEEPALRTYRISAENELLEEEIETRRVPPEERPEYNEDIGGFEKDYQRWHGSIEEKTVGWNRVEYHGVLRFYRSLTSDGDIPDLFMDAENKEWYEYEARFDKGQLKDIKRLDGK